MVNKTMAEKKLIRKITDYVKSHMSVSLIGTGMALFLSAAFLFNGFLQHEYMQYLLAETMKTEKAVLNASATNISSMLQDSIVSCADIVIDRELYGLVENVLENGGGMRDSMVLDSKLNAITHHYNNIAATTVVTDEGLLCEYGRYWDRSGYNDLWQEDNLEILSWLYDEVMKRIEENSSICYAVSTEPLSHEGFPEMILFHLAYPLVGDNVKKTESCAVVVFTLRLDMMIRSSALGNIDQSEYITQYITDRGQKLLYHSGDGILGEKEKDAGNPGMESLEMPLDYLDWTIHIDIDTNDMKQKVQVMFGRGVVVYLVLLLACILAWQFLLMRILRPVGFIGKVMEKTRKGDLSKKIEIRGTHELWQLAEQYNYTVDALIEQQKETKRQYEEKTRMLEKCNAAEKEALESQINAHFLCNTLGAINYSAMENGDMEVSELLKNLSGILYYAFSRETKTVNFGEEIEWVRQYLFLQKFRLMDVFDYEIIFPEEYNEWPCCKLFLQPFVENSILHGFGGWDRGGKIKISGQEKNDRLIIKVLDNGKGMDTEKAKEIREILDSQATMECNQIGIGVSNVVARLRMYYGPDMKIELETELGKGTCFTFWLPIPADLLKESMEIPEEESY